MSGRVLLVGAGPGDPGLLTVRALEAISRADVILYDRATPPAALTHARPDALLIDVGKVGGGRQVPQAETQRLMIEHAKAGKLVVRLKGGDPFVFGRGGEEALACRENSIPFEVVPGVTAAVGATAYAGIPVTHRRIASAVAFVTGHATPDPAWAGKASEVDWPGLAKFHGTLVFYMGVRALPQIADALISEGRSPDEPAAVIERGTLPSQRVIRGVLGDIAQRAAQAGVQAPAVTVVGKVAELADELDWLGDGPLGGVTVVVTRTPAQSSGMTTALRELGARVLEAPAIAIEPLEAEIPDLRPYDLLVLTSPNGARLFFDRLVAGGRDARALAGCRVAVVGPGTAEAVRRRGIEPDVVPGRAVGEALAESLSGLAVERALVARAEQARDVVPDALRAGGAKVDILSLYRTSAATLDEQTREAVVAADWATFASASAARHLVEAVGAAAIRAGSLRLASIGPVTSEALREAGLEPDLQASEHTPDGLLTALVAAVRG